MSLALEQLGKEDKTLAFKIAKNLAYFSAEKKKIRDFVKNGFRIVPGWI